MRPRRCSLSGTCLVVVLALARWLLAYSHAAAAQTTTAVAPAQLLANALASQGGMLYVDTDAVLVLNATGAVGTLANGTAATLAGLGGDSALDFGEAATPLFSIAAGGSLTLQSLRLLNLYTMGGQALTRPGAALATLPAFAIAPGGTLTLADVWVTMSCDDLTIWMSKACGNYSFGVAAQVLEDRLYVSQWIGSGVTYANVTFACAANSAPAPTCLTAAIGDGPSLFTAFKTLTVQWLPLYVFLIGDITLSDEVWPDTIFVGASIYLMGPAAANASNTTATLDFGAMRQTMVSYGGKGYLELRNLVIVNLAYPQARRDWGSLFSIFVDPLRTPRSVPMLGSTGAVNVQLVDTIIMTPDVELNWWSFGTTNGNNGAWIKDIDNWFLPIFSVDLVSKPGMEILQLRQADKSIQFTNVELAAYSPTASDVGTFQLYPLVWDSRFDLNTLQLSSIARVTTDVDDTQFLNPTFDIWGALAEAAVGNHTNLLLIEDVTFNVTLETYSGQLQVANSVIVPSGKTTIVLAGNANPPTARRRVLDVQGVTKVLEVPYYPNRYASIRLMDLIIANPAPGGMLPDGSVAPAETFDWAGGDAAFANLSTPLWWIGCSLRDYPINPYPQGMAPPPPFAVVGLSGISCIDLQRVTIVVPQKEIDIMLYFAGLSSPSPPATAAAAQSSTLSASRLQQHGRVARRLAQSPSPPTGPSVVDPAALVLPGKAFEALRNLSVSWTVSDYSETHLTFDVFHHYGVSGVNVTLTSTVPDDVDSGIFIPELYTVTYDPTPYSPPPPSPSPPHPPPSPSPPLPPLSPQSRLPPLLPLFPSPPLHPPSPSNMDPVGGGTPIGGIMHPVPPTASSPAPPDKVPAAVSGSSSGNSWVGAAVGVPLGIAVVAGLVAAVLVVRRRRQQQTPPFHDGSGDGVGKGSAGGRNKGSFVKNVASDSAPTSLWRRLFLIRAATTGGTPSSVSQRTTPDGRPCMPHPAAGGLDCYTPSSAGPGSQMQASSATSGAGEGSVFTLPQTTGSLGTGSLQVHNLSAAVAVMIETSTADGAGTAESRPGQDKPVSAPAADSTPRGALRELATAVAMVQREVNDEQLTITSVLGQGSFGVVYQGTWRGLPVAVKTVLFQDQIVGRDARRRQRVILEAAISANLHHPNVVSTYAYEMTPLNVTQQEQPGAPAMTNLHHMNAHDPGAIAKDYKLFIIQEFCDGGALRQMVEKGTFCPPEAVSTLAHKDVYADSTLTEAAAAEEAAAARDVAVAVHIAKVVAVALDVARGMAHIHSKNIIHGDLSSGNILLKLTTPSASQGDTLAKTASCQSGSDADDDARRRCQSLAAVASFNFTSKVADFGLSVRMNKGVTHVSNHRQGTPMYMAPEVVSEGRLTKAADVYSYGVLLWELFHGKTVHQGVQAFMARYPRFQLMMMAGSVAPSEVLKFAPTLMARADPCMHAYSQLASMCLSHDARMRPTFEQLVEVLQRVQQEVLSGTQPQEMRADQNLQPQVEHFEGPAHGVQHMMAHLLGDLALLAEEHERQRLHEQHGNPPPLGSVWRTPSNVIAALMGVGTHLLPHSAHHNNSSAPTGEVAIKGSDRKHVLAAVGVHTAGLPQPPPLLLADSSGSAGSALTAVSHGPQAMPLQQFGWLGPGGLQGLAEETESCGTHAEDSQPLPAILQAMLDSPVGLPRR